MRKCFLSKLNFRFYVKSKTDLITSRKCNPHLRYYKIDLSFSIKLQEINLKVCEELNFLFEVRYVKIMNVAIHSFPETLSKADKWRHYVPYAFMHTTAYKHTEHLQHASVNLVLDSDKAQFYY